MTELEQLLAYTRTPLYRSALDLPAEPTETYEPLAQGEYNRNYVFTHPVTGQKLVFRVNYGSQMHLADQIGYEAHALELLEPSGRTPKLRFADGSLTHMDHGVLVMDYLPGTALDYTKPDELSRAMQILADIHSVPVTSECGLLAPENGLRAILDECEAMVKTYFAFDGADAATKRTIRELLDLGWTRADELAGMPVTKCIINTELNNTNFLMPDYLVDWEKPLYGDPAQDLGHFLAPTTTFWKTDVIFTEEQMDRCVSDYVTALDGRMPADGLRERTAVFTAVTCLRGVTWCAMAWVEYRQPGRELVNESTARKLGQYLEPEFLDGIRSFLIK